MTNQIDPALLLSNYQQPQKKTASNALGKDDFLKLLMTQLQNQDPSNPMEDTEFIAQMAQFSTLEQITNMNSTMERFIQLQEQNQLVSYHQFIGKEINWHKLNELENGESEVIEGTGKIQSIQFIMRMSYLFLKMVRSYILLTYHKLMKLLQKVVCYKQV